MLGLPAHPGRVGELLLAAGVLVALLAAPLVWRRTLAATGGAVAVAAVTALLLVSTAAAAPFVAWRIVEDVHYASRLTRPQAERIGGDMAHVDWRAYSWLRTQLPPRTTYYIDLPQLPQLHRLTAQYWSGYVLLPRIRVLDPRQADWVVGWDKRPDVHGVRLRPVAKLTLARRGWSPSTLYLAKVLR